MSSKTDLIIILAILGVAVFILIKSGIFKTLNSASDLANTVVSGANKVTEDIVALPENLATIVNPGTWIDVVKSAGTQIEAGTGWDLPDWLTLGTGNVRENLTDRVRTMAIQAQAMFPSATDAIAITRASQAGYKFDAQGYLYKP